MRHCERSSQLSAVHLIADITKRCLRHPALTRYSVALVLARRGRFADAKDYAVAALRGYEAYGGGAKEEVLKTRKLIAAIEKDLKGSDE
jgi:hypothetical protein